MTLAIPLSPLLALAMGTQASGPAAIQPPAPVQPPTPASAPVQPAAAPVQPAPVAAPAPVQAAPAPVAAQPPPPQQAPSVMMAPARRDKRDKHVVTREQPNGLGFLIAGPITVALGIPFSFLGNRVWRESCGPSNSDSDCARGTSQSMLAHTFAGLAFSGGIGLTAAGGKRRGAYDARWHAESEGVVRNRSALLITGAVVLPISVIGISMARLFFWLPTPECQTSQCVRRYQHTSTVAVSGLALLASAGAGMLMYGSGYQRWTRRNTKVAVSPQLGRKMAGLSLRGEF